ncbi:MAG: hypothetical protein KIT00_09350 [Rhodospirillales bacterium]|nr:hypothetical protein [Rhodospirillales bacterium]
MVVGRGILAKSDDAGRWVDQQTTFGVICEIISYEAITFAVRIQRRNIDDAVAVHGVIGD